MKNILIIDGNYFGHRLLHGMRGSAKEITLDSLEEQANFASGLNNSMLNIYASFNNEWHTLLDNIVFVFDNESWRKTIPGFRPYYITIDSAEKIGYKDNREDLKAESNINWDNFNKLMNEFYERLNPYIPCFRVVGCEGDDAFLLLRDHLKDEDIKLWLFATDGDLSQLVNQKTLLFKNVSSKVSPDGEYYISEQTYSAIFNQKVDMLSLLSKPQPNRLHYFDMFKVQLNGGRARSQAERKPNVNIFVAEPLLTGLIKTICGDKKDNVFPLFRWVKNGKNYKVTEKMLGDVWKLNGFGELCEATAVKFFLDKNIQITTLVGLIMKAQSNQIEKIDKQMVLDHYRHNLKVIILRKENLPEHVKTLFVGEFLLKKDKIMNTFSIQDMLKINLTTETIDSATELQISSVPSQTKINNPSDSQTAYMDIPDENKSLIDDILNA